MVQSSIKIAVIIALAFICARDFQAQAPNTHQFTIRDGGTVEVINRFGRVDALVEAANTSDESGDSLAPSSKITISAKSSGPIVKEDLRIDDTGSKIVIEVKPKDTRKRIDIALIVPPRTKLQIETREGEVKISGDLASAHVVTDTGTIAADVPTDDLRYAFHWSSSRPRYLSDVKLTDVKEKAAGKFEIKGRFSLEEETRRSGDEETGRRGELVSGSEPRAVATGALSSNGTSDSGTVSHSSVAGLIADAEGGASKNKKKARPQSKAVSLNFTTARGIILLNIPPNEVTGDLRERPLSNAAKAIVRSGDSLLMEAIRRAAPKYFGDYARTLPPVKLEPSFAEKAGVEEASIATIKTATVRVTDLNNRSIAGLQQKDFEITESNERREIVSVEPVTAPFNLVLLLDVSGSVDTYVNFIRKAARSFVETVDARDRVSIVIFNDDVNKLSGFTTDKAKLSSSLDTFDAGGGTAYYDSLAYVVADTLRPLKGERTAIVVLTDGDDNRSFLPFDSMLASIQESGALIYPLYVPSALIAAAETSDTATPIDTLRSRYLEGELTSKARAEGAKLAETSGGVYYPITRVSEIQKAYDDIAAQLRTAYNVKFRSATTSINASGASPRLKIKVNKPNTFAVINSVVKSAN